MNYICTNLMLTMIIFKWRILNLLLLSFLLFAFTVEKPGKKKANHNKPSTAVKKISSPAKAKYNPYYIIVDEIMQRKKNLT